MDRPLSRPERPGRRPRPAGPGHPGQGPATTDRPGVPPVPGQADQHRPGDGRLPVHSPRRRTRARRIPLVRSLLRKTKNLAGRFTFFELCAMIQTGRTLRPRSLATRLKEFSGPSGRTAFFRGVERQDAMAWFYGIVFGSQHATRPSRPAVGPARHDPGFPERVGARPTCPSSRPNPTEPPGAIHREMPKQGAENCHGAPCGAEKPPSVADSQV